MREVERQLDRILTLLRNKIRQRGFTQLEVQEALGWGRSYISQLLTKQKSLRVEQVLLMLNVIGIDPATFFAELYPPETSAYFDRSAGPGHPAAVPQGDYREVQALLRGLVDLLVNREIISAEELSVAVHSGEGASGFGGD
jgi:transcriptional regulator with XRE-family HTH domain